MSSDATGARFDGVLARGVTSFTVFTALFVFAAIGARPCDAAEPVTSGSASTASSASGASSASSAAAEGDAEHLFQRARTLHDQKKWTEAESVYRQAWERQRSFKIAANLALVELKLGKARDAAEHLDFALRNLPPDAPNLTEARAHLERMLAEARTRVGAAAVQVDESGAKVLVDGELVGRTPLDGPLFLTVGSHTIRIEKEGFRAVTKELTAAAGESYDVLLKLGRPQPDASPPVAVAPRAAPMDSARSTSSSLRTVVLISEAALTLTAAGFGIAYAVERSDQVDQADYFSYQLSETYPGDTTICNPSAQARPPECAGLESARDRANELAKMETVAFITAGVLAAGTVATYFLWPANSRSEQGHRGAGLSVAVSVRPDLRGVGVAGSF